MSTLRIGKCSTPFGITEFRGTPLAAGRPVDSLCSTPFGITEFRGTWTADEQAVCARCSTPFGITEFRGRPAWGSTTRPIVRAQRLSASLSFAGRAMSLSYSGP